MTIPVLIALSCAIPEALFLLSTNGLLGDARLRTTAIENFGFWPGLLNDWRPNYPLQPVAMFATYGFLHAGILHFLLNMVTLLSLAVPVVERVGPPRFLLLYVVSLLGGAFAFWLLSDSFSPMVGASGALFGLAGAIIGWDFADRSAANAQLWPILRIVLLLIALNLAMWWAMDGRLAWQTHLGGFIFGWISGTVLDRRRIGATQD